MTFRAIVRIVVLHAVDVVDVDNVAVMSHDSEEADFALSVFLHFVFVCDGDDNEYMAQVAFDLICGKKRRDARPI